MGIFEKALIWGEKILRYIPQREPIVMVDEFFGVEEAYSFSGLTVNESNIFVENGVLNETGIIEHVAQSCALRVGYLCIQNELPVPVGYIGAVKNLKIIRLPKVGDRLCTAVKLEQEVFDITLISFEVSVGSKAIASGKMKIFLEK